MYICMNVLECDRKLIKARWSGAHQLMAWSRTLLVAIVVLKGRLCVGCARRKSDQVSISKIRSSPDTFFFQSLVRSISFFNVLGLLL